MISKPFAVVLVILQLAILAILGTQYVQERQARADGDEYEEDDADEPRTIEDVANEISEARYELRQQVERLTRLMNDLARTGVATAPATPGETTGSAIVAEPAKLTTAQLVDKVIELHEMHNRYEHDPLQREPVEKERAKIEDVLRNRGIEAIDSIAASLSSTADTRAQSRLLEYIVRPIIERNDVASAEAEQLALDVFDTPTYASGVRLIGARLALKSHRDAVIEKLIDILGDTQSEFQHREDIARFFGSDLDPRSVPVLAQLAKDVEVDETVRFFCLDSLGYYKDPIAVETMKDIVRGEVHGNLRNKAMHSLNKVLGKEIVPFLEQIRPTMSPQDPMLQLVQNLLDQYATGN
jgi:hypothetical protein